LHNLLRWLPAASLVSFLYHLSSTPGLRILPKRWLPVWLDKLLASYSLKIGTSGFFSYALSLQPEFVVRKLGHFFAFALLGASVYFAVRSKRTAIVLTILLAVLDEVHQGLVPGRDCRFWDMVLDSVAGVCGVAAYRYWERRRATEKAC
jgi:VanZ family protein